MSNSMYPVAWIEFDDTVSQHLPSQFRETLLQAGYCAAFCQLTEDQVRGVFQELKAQDRPWDALGWMEGIDLGDSACECGGTSLFEAFRADELSYLLNADDPALRRRAFRLSAKLGVESPQE